MKISVGRHRKLRSDGTSGPTLGSEYLFVLSLDFTVSRDEQWAVRNYPSAKLRALMKQHHAGGLDELEVALVFPTAIDADNFVADLKSALKETLEGARLIDGFAERPTEELEIK